MDYKKIPLVRGFVHQVPPYRTGSVIENRLGLQPLRMIGKYGAWKFRKFYKRDTGVEQDLAILERDGILVLPNFLEDEAFECVRKEFFDSENSMKFRGFKGAETGRLEVASVDLDAETMTTGSITTYLRQNRRILDIAASVIRRQDVNNPSVRLTVYRARDDKHDDNDIENVLHADFHAPTVKAFFYLDDVDESNGAFVYVKRSHRLSVRRLWHEYKLSLLAAKLRKGRSISEHLTATRGENQRIRIPEECLVGLVETPICVKANTLVIANNMGFHRRGEFVNGATRRAILLNFRQFEKCFWATALLFNLLGIASS